MRGGGKGGIVSSFPEKKKGSPSGSRGEDHRRRTTSAGKGRGGEKGGNLTLRRLCACRTADRREEGHCFALWEEGKKKRAFYIYTRRNQVTDADGSNLGGGGKWAGDWARREKRGKRESSSMKGDSFRLVKEEKNVFKVVWGERKRGRGVLLPGRKEQLNVNSMQGKKPAFCLTLGRGEGGGELLNLASLRRRIIERRGISPWNGSGLKQV